MMRASATVISGFLLQRTGFRATFFVFAALALAGATIFTVLVPETKPTGPQRTILSGSIEERSAA